MVNFRYGEAAYECAVTDGYIDLPYFESARPVSIGVYGYTVNGETLVLRLSPKPFGTFITQGSYCEGEPAPLPSPGTYESLSARIEHLNIPLATEINADSLNTAAASAKAVYDAIQSALFVDTEETV